MTLWWFAAAAVTVIALAWALPMRRHERPTGGLFDGMGYAFGAGLRVLIALVVSLSAWLLWALLA